jgi:histone H3/H4
MLPKRPFKNLAKSNDVKRISRKAVIALSEYAERYSLGLIKKADEYRKAAKRTTILHRDVEQAAETN